MGNKLGSKSDTYALTASTTPKKLCSANKDRANILVVNNGSVTVYITSGQSKTASDGIPVAASQSYNNDTTTAELWVLTSSSTSELRIQEDGQ
jgi:hypothetical protein